MTDKKLIWIAVVLAVISLVVVLFRPTKTIIQRISDGESIVGALASPDIPSPYLKWGGVETWRGFDSFDALSTTTVCAIQAPAATSTLTRFAIQITTATGTDAYMTVHALKDAMAFPEKQATSSNAYAVGTATSTYITSGRVVKNTFPTLNYASSTLSSEMSLSSTDWNIIPPNYYLVVRQTGGGIATTTDTANESRMSVGTLSGSCVAEFLRTAY